jgi:hypothetical protein
MLTLLVTVLTNNLINGMALGTLSYIALATTPLSQHSFDRVGRGIVLTQTGRWQGH